MMTEYQCIVALVGEMRAAQKQYFKFRTDTLLRQSKELEKRVDAAILALKKDAGQKQGELV